MKNLLILRHASSAKQGPDGTDFSRPLTDEGEREAGIQGLFLREAGILPAHIATSSAERARHTTELLAQSLGNDPAIDCSETLYNAPGDILLEYVRTLSDAVETALVVGHMPGVAEMLILLAPEFAEVAVAFSPGTMAGVSLPDHASWSALEPGCGVLEWLLPPLLIGE